MSTGNAERQARSLMRGTDDVLEHLTLAHAENFDRHGPVMGVEAPAPADAVAFKVQQEQLGNAIDDATESGAKLRAVMVKDAHYHEQIGRLAAHVAGYTAAHGDPGDVPSMRELSRSHFALAAELRGEIVPQDGLGRYSAEQGGDMDDLMPPDLQESAANQNNRRGPGRGL